MLSVIVLYRRENRLDELEENEEVHVNLRAMRWLNRRGRRFLIEDQPK